MNGNLYNVKPLVNSSFLQRLFKQLPEENAVIEVNNLLATKPIKDILQKEIEEIENRYKLNLKKEFYLNLEEFYTVYLNYCLADKVLNEQESTELNHLKYILNLDNNSIEKLYVELGKVIYKESYQEAVANGRLTKDKEDFLNILEKTLRLPKELADKISSETRINFIENYVTQIVADQKLSPAEEQELAVIANSLKVNIQLNDQTKEQLKKLKVYWALENLDLPIIQPDIVLQKSEICHIKISNVNWYELRSVRQKVSYSGYSTSFKVAKGFYLRSGSYRPSSYSIDTMKLIDAGTLFLTNKRIIFTGTRKNSNIRIDKILDFKPYTDGVEIGKDTGKSPTLQMAVNADVFCIMLERLLNER